MDLSVNGCVRVGSSLITNVPFWWGMLIIAKFMYMGYHIPLSFAVTLKSKKLKSFLKKKKSINSGNKVGKHMALLKFTTQ